MTPTLRWVAARDGEAHARIRSQPRTLCGKIALDERYGWPERSRCETCIRLALASSADSEATHTRSPSSQTPKEARR